VPTSKRPQSTMSSIRVSPAGSWKVRRMKRSSVVVETIIEEAGEIILVLNVWSVETSRYPAWLQRVWRGHSRHVDLREVLRQKRPSTQKCFAGPSACTRQKGLHSDVKSRVSRTGWRGCKSTPTSDGHASRAPN
jgi:hypothetical protein